MHFPKTLFVTGSDTDVGKTIISAILLKGLNAHYWKPIQSGINPATDTGLIRQLTQLPDSHYYPETYRLIESHSPHASALIDGVKIDLKKCRMPLTNTHLIIEGAGGVLVPLNENELMIDLIKMLDVPVLIVIRSGLGTINHSLLTIEALRSREIPIFGVVMNGPQNESNRKAIEGYGNVTVIAEIEPLDEFSPDQLKNTFTTHFGGMIPCY